MTKHSLPPGWQRVRLGDVLEQVDRFESVHPERGYRLLGVKWYAAGVFERERKLGKSIAAKQLNRVEEGDFIYNRLFAWKGSFALVKDGCAGGYVSGEFPVFRAKPGVILEEFLYRYFSRPQVWKRIERQSTGTTSVSRNRWREEQFFSWHISLPPLDEQRRISAVLNAIDDAIQANEEVIIRAQEINKALAYELLTRGLPGYHIRFKDSAIGMVPEEWSIRRLGEFADVQAGIALGKHRRPKNNGRPYLRVANVLMDRLSLTDVKLMEILPDEYERCKLNEGDVLLVEGHAQISQLGRAALATAEVSDFFYQNHIFRVRPKIDVCFGRYLCLFINSKPGRRYIEEVGKTTSGLNTVNSSKIRGMPVALPSLTEQKSMCSIVDAYDKRLADAQEMLRYLVMTRLDLTQELLSGSGSRT